MAVNPLSLSVAVVPRGDTTPQSTTPSATDSDTNDNRVAIFSTVAGTWTFTVDSAKAGGEEAYFACAETTLYASWNTTLNPFNYAEVVNISNSNLTVIWIARDFSGATFSATLTVPANRRVDIDLHSIVGQPNFGDIKVKHDGPIGAIRGGDFSI